MIIERIADRWGVDNDGTGNHASGSRLTAVPTAVPANGPHR